MLKLGNCLDLIKEIPDNSIDLVVTDPPYKITARGNGGNSGGIGAKFGFIIKRILLVAHGGWHNDTICTVEVKL